MSSAADSDAIFFGPFPVTSQVFYKTAQSFALVNLKPLLPGHVLVCPRARHQRLTDLSAAELTDLWTAVQLVQRVLAATYFVGGGKEDLLPDDPVAAGSFNLAVQDGAEAGQTVPHVHVHVIPRTRPPPGGGAASASAIPGGIDELYERMAAEPGNVGGQLWDRAVWERAARRAEVEEEEEGGVGERPKPGGAFPSIEDAMRMSRTMKEMEDEAEGYRRMVEELTKGGE